MPFGIFFHVEKKKLKKRFLATMYTLNWICTGGISVSQADIVCDLML